MAAAPIKYNLWKPCNKVNRPSEYKVEGEEDEGKINTLTSGISKPEDARDLAVTVIQQRHTLWTLASNYTDMCEQYM